MWHNHPFSQRNKATKRESGRDVISIYVKDSARDIEIQTLDISDNQIH